jgi:hypothetical protein
MLAEHYSYTITQQDRALTIVLTKLSDGRTKTFFQAAGSLEGMTCHMNSLTDDNCDSFFPAERKKKEKPAK